MKLPLEDLPAWVKSQGESIEDYVLLGNIYDVYVFQHKPGAGPRNKILVVHSWGSDTVWRHIIMDLNHPLHDSERSSFVLDPDPRVTWTDVRTFLLSR